MENRFEAKNRALFINGRKVLRAWESYTGWYWFAVEKVEERLSLIGSKPVKDTIWFGLVQGLENEWGDFSQAELESLRPKVWEIRKRDLLYAGRRDAVRLLSEFCVEDIGEVKACA
jgi:hypothetical protein